MTSTNTGLALVRAEIDAAALRANAASIDARLAPARLRCILKADAYGHGVDLVAPVLAAAGHSRYGVATVSEALHLRDVLGPDAEILAWLYSAHTELAPAVAADIELGASRLADLDRLDAAGRATGRPARIHLKVDTGLGRNGFTVHDFGVALTHLADLASRPDPGLRIVGLMSHFAVADEPDRTETAEQCAVFDTALAALRRTLDEAGGRAGDAEDLDVHIANSPGAFSLGVCPGTTARVGLALYGLSPFEDRDADELDLIPAMRLVSSIINLKHIPAGHGASYGLSYHTKVDTRFALVAGGYGDGLFRSASNRAEVTVRGRRYPVIGRIAMDQMIIDVGPGDVPGPDEATADADIAIGDEVTIFGPGGPSATEWAEWAGTINYEVITRIGARVDHVVVDSDAEDAKDTGGSAVPGRPTGTEAA